MNFKKVLTCILIFTLSAPFAYADVKVSDDCVYKSQFELCQSANSQGTTRTIEDFICIESTDPVLMMQQIIMDIEFREIDKEVTDYLHWLQREKDYYFGKNAKEPFLKAIDEIESQFGLFGYFGKKYDNICKMSNPDGVLQSTMACFGGSVSSPHAIFSPGEGSDCRRLILTKLEINKQVAYDILKLNKLQVKKDEDKAFMQQQRTSYEKILDLFMINLGYLERIWKKWPSKTKDAQAK